MSAVASGVAWYRRLGFRLAILMAGTMLAFDFLSPMIYQQVQSLLGHPTEEETWVLPTEWIREFLRTEAAQEGPGRWRLGPDATSELYEVFRIDGESFVWIDVDGWIMASAPDLPFEVNTAWPHPLEMHQEITLIGDPPRQVSAFTFPLSVDGAPAGTFVRLLMDRALHAEEVHGVAEADLIDEEECDYLPLRDTVLLTEQQAEVVDRSKSRIKTISSIVIVSLSVLLFAFVTSRLVTRRLTRLSRLASDPESTLGEVPGPFPAIGRDEIALLSKSMNSMHEKVLGLLAGMKKREADRREWVAQVSHDLRTPLTALLACLERSHACLQEADPEKLKRDVAELFSVAKMDALRVQALADDLLEIARLEAGSGLDLEPVPPGELVRQTVRALSPLAEVRGVELRAEVDPGLPTLQADGRRLMRAVENLLKNAVHHAERSVQVRATLAGGKLLLEVRDDGAGLPEENGTVVLSRLSGQRSRENSSGLGLVVAERVARAHGGRIGARNLADGGAAVWLALPLQEEGEAEP